MVPRMAMIFREIVERKILSIQFYIIVINLLHRLYYVIYVNFVTNFSRFNQGRK